MEFSVTLTNNSGLVRHQPYNTAPVSLQQDIEALA
jgi:hypothetical protein